MSEYDELVKQLRGSERLIRLDCLFDGKPDCVCSHCEASGTIARLAAERDALKAEVERLKETITTATKFNEGLAEEVERLKGALGEVMEWIENWRPPFTHDEEWPATERKARSALEVKP